MCDLLYPSISEWTSPRYFQSRGPSSKLPTIALSGTHQKAKRSSGLVLYRCCTVHQPIRGLTRAKATLQPLWPHPPAEHQGTLIPNSTLSEHGCTTLHKHVPLHREKYGQHALVSWTGIQFCPALACLKEEKEIQPRPHGPRLWLQLHRLVSFYIPYITCSVFSTVFIHENA